MRHDIKAHEDVEPSTKGEGTDADTEEAPDKKLNFSEISKLCGFLDDVLPSS